MRYHIKEVDGFRVTQAEDGEVVGVMQLGRATPPTAVPDLPIGKMRASEFASVLQAHLLREISPLVEQVQDLQKRVEELEGHR